MTGNCFIYKQNLSRKFQVQTYQHHTVTKLKSKHSQLNPLPANRVACRGVADAKIEIQKTILDDEDVAKLIKDFNFPIPSETLIEKAKKFQESTFDESMMADDFQFIPPVVGPLGKKELLAALKSFNTSSFTDAKANFYGFTIDPFQPNRVWMFTEPRGSFFGTYQGKQPVNDKYFAPPQMVSLTFNEQGLITKLTGGYVLDRTCGNTGGLGGIFGLLYAFGAPVPFPEYAKVYKRSWQFKLAIFLGELRTRFSQKD
eukprot:TRINITY_DN501_c0_g1_i5.p1 TRINITY_DN501_c0_g1~~TRINITY_DN501_c0_g1_i5.p1  ORF type:complete len:257 (+),score=14.98 TRINITY_DN501_c0_g1_i5:123-893(+)